MQFQVDTAAALAMKLRVCMDRDDSIIYVGFSIRLKYIRSDPTMAWLKLVLHMNDG